MKMQPSSRSPVTRRPTPVRAFTAIALLTLLCGCQRAPSFSILGSFFPGWLFCTVAGVLLAFLLHLLLLRLEVNEQLAPPLLIYPAIATLFTLGLWLLFLS